MFCTTGCTTRTDRLKNGIALERKVAEENMACSTSPSFIMLGYGTALQLARACRLAWMLTAFGIRTTLPSSQGRYMRGADEETARLLNTVRRRWERKNIACKVVWVHCCMHLLGRCFRSCLPHGRYLADCLLVHLQKADLQSCEHSCPYVRTR